MISVDPTDYGAQLFIELRVDRGSPRIEGFSELLVSQIARATSTDGESRQGVQAVLARGIVD